MLKKTLLFTCSSILLSACVEPMTWQERLALYQTKCQDFGYPAGTAEFSQCIEKQDRIAIEQAERAADRQNLQSIENTRQWGEDRRLEKRLKRRKKHKHS